MVDYWGELGHTQNAQGTLLTVLVFSNQTLLAMCKASALLAVLLLQP